MAGFRIRSVTPDDAAAYLDLLHRLDDETALMMWEPRERATTVDEQQEWIAAILARDNRALLVAEVDGQLIGFLLALGGGARRASRTALLVVGILREYWGRGVGTALFAAIEAWAREAGLHRLELTVMAHNTRAIALYQKMGFVVEGTTREALFVDGQFVDEHHMGKLL